jgi:hypothetical protein
MNPQPSATRGVGITMKPQRENFWASKAPLWLIAISLFTIACCLVLLVLRTVAPDDLAAQPNSVTNATKTADAPPTDTSPRRWQHVRGRDDVLLVRNDSSRTTTAIDKKDDVTLAAVTTPAPQPAVLALNSRSSPFRPSVLYSAQYENGIKGTVRLKGAPPPETTIENINVPCAEPDQMPRTTRFFVVDTNGGLADALVFLSDGIDTQVFPPTETPVELVFTNCLIEPYVSAVMPKQPFSVRDVTGLAHKLNFSASSGGILPLKASLGAGDTTLLTKYLNPGTFQRISCDVHPWEFAYVSVLRHPFFAVTDEHGEFSITNIPPGRYTVEVKHRSGTNRGSEQAQKSVRLLPGSSITLDFEINAPAH